MGNCHLLDSNTMIPAVSEDKMISVVDTTNFNGNVSVKYRLS